MNERQSIKKIQTLFLESRLPIWSKEGLILHAKLSRKYFVEDPIDPQIIKEAKSKPRLTEKALAKLTQEIIKIKQDMICSAPRYDNNN